RVALVVDAAVHVHAALAARIAFDHGRGVDDLELVGIRDDLELVARHDRDHREQRAFRLPAFRAAADVIVRALSRDPDLDRTIAAMTPERPAREIGRSWPYTLVYRGVNRDRHRRSPARSIVATSGPGRPSRAFGETIEAQVVFESP